MQIIEETLPALQELKKEGLIRNIGFSGLPLAIYKKVLDRLLRRLISYTPLPMCRLHTLPKLAHSANLAIRPAISLFEKLTTICMSPGCSEC